MSFSAKFNITPIDISEQPASLGDIAQVEEELTEIDIIIKQISNKWKIFYILGAFFAISSISLSVYLPFFYTGDTKLATGKIVLIGIFGVLYGALTAITGYIFNQSRKSRYIAERDRLISKKKIIEMLDKKRLQQDVPDQGDYFDELVGINVRNLSSYYTLVRVHTDNSFQASYICGIIGFILITIGMIFGYIQNEKPQITTYIATGSGILTEFIAGVFFVLYQKTVKQLKGYHDSLLAVQNTLLSFKITENIKDENEKAKIIGQLVLSLVQSGSNSKSEK